MTTDDSEEDVLIDAKQLYQHDPLFVLLKERWQLQDHWIVFGSAALPAVVLPFFGAWVAVSKTHNWTLYTTVAVLLEIGVL
ncbi:MAG: hypothetical protein JO202_13490 [Ktedonobacteraceae bacterium]|nr:hypothetical protein [Ktedonobacteraceae bacterium]